MKQTVPPCQTCGKAPDMIIVWYKSGDTEVSCMSCHAVIVLAAQADVVPDERMADLPESHGSMQPEPANT